ncbi:hypothetical protein [Tessaracoccus flavescens]|uniref:hypothetical protein n=1 Tax=Tessaracoccus flavescens TaxID=399497 RepID=UPI00193113CC|nr:hypothetical protein [Tessaracoccus flavescens]
MLITKAISEGIREGRITTQYRRWDAPSVKVGGTQLTPSGLVRFTRVARVPTLERVTDRAARAAGFRDAAALRKMLAPRDPGAPRRVWPRSHDASTDSTGAPTVPGRWTC